MGQIDYRPDLALWPGDKTVGAVEFFHRGRYARTAVTIHVVEDDVAREILYRQSLFAIPPGNPALTLPGDLGFAGFRVMNPAAAGDWIAYVGASYFRAADPLNQYGLSARGLAIDTAVEGPEEFPVFSSFWLEHTPKGLIVSALLEGPSVTGAFRIGHRRDATSLVQSIESRLHFRAPVRRLGIAPLTSMFWYNQGGRADLGDWRPQIHDSDGLSLWTGAGERIWRPLNNPPRVVTNTFVDQDPKGFGLMQRDRSFADYQDDGAFYDRRPSAWVEPAPEWGPGSVALVEIPTKGETDDNIVAFWTPAKAVAAGDTLAFIYRLYWAASEPVPVGVARVVGTRVGRGGRPGQPPPSGVRKFVVDFEGGRLPELTRQSGVTPVVTLGEGEAMGPVAYPIVGTSRWRLMFDVALAPGKTLDLRAFLRLGVESLTETWIEQAFG
jgi:glucans biosynthesis protein